MNKIIFFISVALLSSCIDADIFDTPINELSGEFDYTSSSIFYDDQGVNYQTSQNTGVMAISISSEVIVVTPTIGWEYRLDISDITTHTLENGETVYSFNVDSQSISVSDDRFLISGISSQSITTGGETYDGLYYEDESIDLEIESNNSLNFERVETVISASFRD